VLIADSCTTSNQLSQGKRKAKTKPAAPKKREGLATTFTCLFCNHENAIIVKIDKKGGVGNLYCKVCGQKFQTSTNYLSVPADVYSDWVDACEDVAQQAADLEREEQVKDREFSNYASRSGRTVGGDEEDEEDDGDYT
jgi:transcription elongation factor Elf1